MVAIIAKTAIHADPNFFSIAREEHLPDDITTQSRPGDVSLNLGDGRMYADLTVANPFKTARVTASRLAGSPVAAVEMAFDRKLRGWNDILNSNGLDPLLLSSKFIPLSVTSIGVWDARFIS